MKKNFNGSQILKSSDDCDKYSTSVSYETLVGGTAATGRGIKQIRRLFLGNAVKPLTAVDTLTSFLCNSAKVVEKWLQISPVFRFVKVLGLVVVLSAVIICKSQAIEIPTGGVSGTCNSAGTCLWTLDENGKMTISATEGAKEVVMEQYTCDDSSNIGNRPWEAHITKIKDVVVGDNIINISNNAFQYAIQLETVTGMKDVKVLGVDSFAYDKKLNLVEMPSVEEVLDFALSFSSITSVDLPNIKKIIHGFGAKIEYIGLPDWDVEMINLALSNTKIPNCSNENRTACGSCGNDYVKRGVGCVSDCGTGYLGKEGRCIDASLGCGAGYRQFENFCNRIRYTPAEAAQVLRDDNKNEIVITFKK